MLQAMPAADDQPHPLPKFLDQHLSHKYKENRDNNNKERREGGNTYRTILLLSHTGRVQLLNLSLATETSYITLSLTSFRTFVSATSMAKLGVGHPHY